MRPLLNAEFHKYPYHGKLLRELMHSLQKPFPGSSKPYDFPFKKFPALRHRFSFTGPLLRHVVRISLT